jgi:hypothetical protein
MSPSLKAMNGFRGFCNVECERRITLWHGRPPVPEHVLCKEKSGSPIAGAVVQAAPRRSDKSVGNDANPDPFAWCGGSNGTGVLRVVQVRSRASPQPSEARFVRCYRGIGLTRKDTRPSGRREGPKAGAVPGRLGLNRARSISSMVPAIWSHKGWGSARARNRRHGA